MQRSAQRPAQLLVRAAAVALPMTLVTACSSGSPGTGTKSAAVPASASSPAGSVLASATPTPGRFAKLPDACSAISQKTVKALVPKARNAKGDAVQSSNTDSHGGCSWNGLNGYQYRWLSVSLERFDSIQGIGPANTQATHRYTDEVSEVEAAKGATSDTTYGVGDQARTVTVEVTRDKETHEEITVVARTGNTVIVLDYNGAGFQDARTPKAAELRKDAVSAAKETVQAVAAANA